MAFLLGRAGADVSELLLRKILEGILPTYRR